jgi:hypothetical protein
MYESNQKKKLESAFHEADTMHLPLPITDCSADRAFFKTARVKKDLQASMLNHA